MASRVLETWQRFLEGPGAREDGGYVGIKAVVDRLRGGTGSGGSRKGS